MMHAVTVGVGEGPGVGPEPCEHEARANIPTRVPYDMFPTKRSDISEHPFQRGISSIGLMLYPLRPVLRIPGLAPRAA